MPSEDFLFDAEDPETVQVFTVPAGVSRLWAWAAGGGTEFTDTPGAYLGPVTGLRFSFDVTPGEEFGVLLGGGAAGTVGGWNGGGDGGGGYSPPNGWRGYGGGGRTEIFRNGDLWAIAAGSGGPVGPGTSADEEWIRFAPGDPVPGAGDPPRAVVAYDPPDPPDNPVLVDEIPGLAGGTETGAAGVISLDGMVGSGGGGGGYGGGSSGSVRSFEWVDPFAYLDPFTVATAGRNGGFLVPPSIDENVRWTPYLGLDVYPVDYADGFVRFGWVVSTSGPWSVGSVGIG